jgi:hypothetical protein
MAPREAMTDAQLLEALDLHEHCGWTGDQIAARFGTTRGAILGAFKRIRDDLAASEAAGFAPGTGPAVRPGNRDGDLGPRWWVRKAARRGAA